MAIKRHTRLIVLLELFCLFPLLSQIKPFDQTISIQEQETTFAQLLEQVSAQCSCYFSYPSELVKANKTIKVDSYNGDAIIFLQGLFDQAVHFKKYKNQIIITPQKQQVTETPQSVESKDYIIVKGTVQDSLTHKGIPNANIVIHGTMFGSSTNSLGEFALKIPAQFRDSSLVFSCLAYYTQWRKISDLTPTSIIRLPLANISLQEVVIRSVGSNYIMEQTRRSLTKNFRTTPYSYSAFYREMAKKNNTYISYNEALFQGYSPKGSITRDDLVLQKARQFISNNAIDTLQLKLKGGTEAVLQLDIANYPPDFLNDKSSSNYTYHINDIQVWHDELVYIIAFLPIKNTEDSKFEGELFVSFKNYTLLGAEFSYSKAYLKEIAKHLIVKKSRKTRVIPLSYKYRVEYQQLNGKYHINYVKGEVNIKARMKRQLRFTTFNTVFEMTLTDINTTNYQKPEMKKRFKTKSIFSESVRFSYGEFWHYDNMIVPEEEIMEAFYKSGFKMETSK